MHIKILEITCALIEIGKLVSNQTSIHIAQLLGYEILPGDLYLWPTTLTYNISLAKVKVNIAHVMCSMHAKCALRFGSPPPQSDFLSVPVK